MTIVELTQADHTRWNTFVAENFSPVGAFMQSWEWGDFKGALHEKIIRYAIEDEGIWVGCFQLELHKLPLGFTYGYAPRGPVLQKDLWTDEKKVNATFLFIAEYLRNTYPELIFVRFEPAHKDYFPAYDVKPFRRLPYYLQPRFNQLVPVTTIEALQKTMSNDIKHDLRAAERLAVSVENTDTLNEEDALAFERMKAETRSRSGKNIFPSERYFQKFLATFKHLPSSDNPSEPYVRYFIAKKEGVAVAINLNVTFAKTLTYLYGASYSGSASKRAPAYLHWKTMQYASENGLEYYDLGGVDDATSSWQGLSYFKKQFGGETLEYIGMVNAVMRPFLYALYVGAKRCSSYLSNCWKVPAKRKK